MSRRRWKKMRLAFAAVMCCVALAGCEGSVRQVLVRPDGGAVALWRNTARARAEAMELMGRQCPAGFDISKEEEVPVGQRVREETRTEIDRRERVTSTTEYRVKTQREWRIHYTCR